MRDHIGLCTGGQEKRVQGSVEYRALWQIDQHAVLDEGGIERGESLVLAHRVLADIAAYEVCVFDEGGA